MAVEEPCPKRRQWRRFASLGAVAALAIPVAAYAATGPATRERDAAIKAGAASGAATAAVGGLKRVRYRGYAFQVPRSWPVIDLARRGRTCVRFDRHAVYLGRPPRNSSCPSMLVGRTEALLIQPGSRQAGWSSVENPVADQITATAPLIRVTATFGAHLSQVDQILASASLRTPVVDVPDPARAAAAPRPRLSAEVANYHGIGFDACAAPSPAYMSAWLRRSPFRAIGVYIGGSDRACAQPELTPGWVRGEAAAGWHFIPMYVGPQAAFGQISAPARQGRAAANDAVMQARRLGFGPRTPLYYDMEAYTPARARAALAFLSAWTSRLHALGYSSGIYGSSNAGVGYLAQQYFRHTYAMPNVIFDALWNGHRNTRDAVFRKGEWANHDRVHQFAGNKLRSYGGDAINIDPDFLDVRLPAREAHRHSAPAGRRG
jgi:Rv2525c-like, glycoside hydrolase-like domain